MGIRARSLLIGGRLVVAVALLSAACSPAGPAAPAAGGSPVQLKLWISGTPALDAAMNKILQQFQTENPNVTVTLEDFPFAQYYEKLTTSLAGGSGPDVYWIDIRTAEFAKRGALLPLDKYVTPDWLADVIPVALKEGEWNGKRYSVPMHELANGIFVNKALFAQAGIQVPHDLKDAWTWSQLRDIGLKLTDRSGGTTTRWGFGSQRDIGDWVVLPYLGQLLTMPLSLPPNFTQFNPLPVKPGEVVGLTVPTWAPVLSYNHTSNKFAYRQSRKANCKNAAAGETAQMSIGANTQYLCSYAGTRVEYSASEITNQPFPKKYVH